MLIAEIIKSYENYKSLIAATPSDFIKEFLADEKTMKSVKGWRRKFLMALHATLRVFKRTGQIFILTKPRRRLRQIVLLTKTSPVI
jgi:hypothetical protein